MAQKPATTEGAAQNTKDWSTDICGCFEDCGGCIFAAILLPCFACGISKRLGENCCVAWLPGGMMAMRTKFRTQYGIKGSLCDDWVCTSCCPQLAMCQLDREMQHVGL